MLSNERRAKKALRMAARRAGHRLGPFRVVEWEPGIRYYVRVATCRRCGLAWQLSGIRGSDPWTRGSPRLSLRCGWRVCEECAELGEGWFDGGWRDCPACGGAGKVRADGRGPSIPARIAAFGAWAETVVRYAARKTSVE